MGRPLHVVVLYTLFECALGLGMVWKLELYLEDLGLLVLVMKSLTFSSRQGRVRYESPLSLQSTKTIFGKQFLGSEFLVTKVTPEK